MPGLLPIASPSSGLALRWLAAALLESAFLLGSVLLLTATLVSSVGSLAAPAPSSFPGIAVDTTDTTATDTTATDTTATDTTATDTTATDTTVSDTTVSDTTVSDTTVSDTTVSDTTAADSLARTRRYLPDTYRHPSDPFPLLQPPAAQRTTQLLPRHLPFWAPRLGSRWKHELSLDSTSTAFRASEWLGEQEVRAPLRASRETYRRARKERDLAANWRSLTEQRARRSDDRSGLGVSMVIPGGSESAFSTIFGKNEVSLSINGQANVDAGLNYKKSDRRAARTGEAGRLNPDFKQDLRLGVTGSIGDKMQIDVNWDTQSQFDYQNQVKLHYTGYEDEIIQSVEAGNVLLETPSTLINGGQSLFGIKSRFQLGGLNLTTIASQQEGTARSLSIEGGSETTEINLSAGEYDNDKHFFLAYYFRNRWNEALRDPPNVQLANGFDKITKLQVWKTKPRGTQNNAEVRNAVALVDLGEADSLLRLADAYTADGPDALPDSTRDQYGGAILDDLRPADADLNQLLVESGRVESEADYHEGELKLLEEGQDYEFDRQLGYLSLQQGLRPNEALAVAFRYQTSSGEEFQVGALPEAGGSSGGSNDEHIVLKLLRPQPLAAPGPNSNPAAWYLTMRNIYELQGRNFDPENFELDLQYHAPGSQTAQAYLPIDRQRPLLELLGLDRLNEDLQPRPDGAFDYLNGFTINAGEGLLVFPYLEPFGQRLRQVVEEQSDPSEEAESLDEYVFSSLYRKKQQTVEDENRDKYNRYQINGSYKGGVPDFYDLRAFSGLVEGSVKVTSGGTPLTEGTDYIVDYSGGTVTITNDSYLTAGRDLNIEYEQNSFTPQKKTLLGARAGFTFQDHLSLGATLMRLSQKPTTDKLRIGQEPISNTIWGVDGQLDLQPRWLTRALDALPLVQTKAPSAIEFGGEFAQLLPGHNQTRAFEIARDTLTGENAFRGDELRGISYLDDFEGFENNFSFMTRPRNWHLSAAPADSLASCGAPAGNARRATFAWYQLNNGIVEDLADVPTPFPDPTKRLVDVREVYPDRDVSDTRNNLRTFDLYFDPGARGPYNYTSNLKSFLDRPACTWGGMTQRLPDGQTDFGTQNIEFVEFVFKPYYEETSSGENSPVLHLNLGSISEDIIPNAQDNGEDGLLLTDIDERSLDGDGHSRLPDGFDNSTIDIEGDRTEDLGLDGLVSYAERGVYPEVITERVRFADFLSSLDSLAAGASSQYRAEHAKARRDPSGDDYHFYNDEAYFGDASLYPGGATFQERLAHYFTGYELNSYTAQNTFGDNASGRGVARNPDAEALNVTGSVERTDKYFQYHLPLDPDELDRLAQPTNTDDYVVSKIGQGSGWYQVRIPVRSPDDSVGAISDFSSIKSIRLWTEGHEAPISLRFAKLELVGSRWRKAEQVAREVGADPTDGRTTPDASSLSITSVNNEEDDIYKKPRRAIVGERRLARGGRQKTREQAMVLRVEELRESRQRAVFKTVDNLNLLKYSNLRMFAHLHGTGDGEPLRERGRAHLFVRLGANENSDYYEYEQPLTPGRLPDLTQTSDELWKPKDNEMNLRLSALNQLKVARDRRLADSTGGVYRDSMFWSDENNVGLNPAPKDFAPPGTRLGIKGTPSLQSINTLVIGLRNPDGSEVLLNEATLWVNELRATGYDERKGWAATASANIQLADLGQIQANLSTRTDGFGDLASTLENRRQRNNLDWSVRGSFDLGKLLPNEHGWSIPISGQIRSRSATPRYAPRRGDVRLAEIIDQVDARFQDPARRDSVRRRIRQSAQTRSLERSVSIGPIQKTGSNSFLLRNTLDALSFEYSFSDQQRHNPSKRLNNRWNWNTRLDYRLTFDNAHTVRPLWFLSDLPIVGGLGSLRFNYAPQSIRLYGQAQRDFSMQQDRTQTLFSSSALPERISDQQGMSHQRGMNVQYDPFEFLQLNFGTTTRQSLNNLSADPRYLVVTPDGIVTDDDAGNRFESTTDAQEYADSLGEGRALVQERLNLASTQGIFQRLFSPGRRPYTNGHSQRFAATFNLPFAEGKAFNWVDVDDLVYESNYRWNNGPLGAQQGAGVTNEMTVRSGLTLHPQKLWRKFGFYRRLEAQHKKDQQEEQERERVEDAEGEDAEGEDAEGEDAEGEDAKGEDAKGEDAEEDAPPPGRERAFSDLLPDPVDVLRSLALAVTGIRDFSVTYSGTRSGQSDHIGSHDGYAGGYSLFGALRGDGPPLGYRFGLQRRIDSNQRVDSTALQVDDLLTNQNEVRARTTLTPFSDLQINLNWNMSWGSNTTYSDVIANADTTGNGSNSFSVWAFGANYRNLFERQLDTYLNNLEAPGSADNPQDEVVLTNATLTRDFRQSFMSTFGTIRKDGFLALPLPTWRIRYSGLSKWPLIGSLTRSATIRHSYDAQYRSGFNRVTLQGEINSFGLGETSFFYRRPLFNASGLNITERYQPLLGIDVSWKGKLQTNFSWNRSNTYQLQTANAQMLENNRNELRLQASYRKQGLEIPFLPFGDLENQITFSLTAARTTELRQQFSLRRALEEAGRLPSPGDYKLNQALQGRNVSELGNARQIEVIPKISYRFSQRVSADFSLRYERFQESGESSRTNFDGGVNVRVSIQN